MQFRAWINESQKPLKVIDTTSLTPDDQWRLGRAAIAGDGEIIGYHVTDEPEKLFQVLQGPRKITATYGKSGRYAELGPGLYISAVPEYWTGRSVGKWDFLHKLTPQERQRLATALLSSNTLNGDEYTDAEGNKRVFKHIADFERDYAIRDIKNWLSHPEMPEMIVGLSGQPYNIKFWEPEYLAKLGIKAGSQPTHVTIKAKGKFVDVSDTPQPGVKLIAQLIKSGYDGGFTKGGFSANPELAIWNKKSITYYGS